MSKEKKDTFSFYYDEAGEKEIMDQITNAYQSGYDYTVTGEHDPQHEEIK
ncbi:hypothetical protein [Bacillus suaedaesalsae]|uniref:Uncharacterized protein n=1 Tax=Bacillus suaedaesalsae TaxID=2810349 RepID=A0ABS2DG61_9BACI|nr:hypothetical protein [Bacillus suaedaesalsae]MBM6617462.1 hypothetical protein [Bacillus suaedaesalsae]